MVKSTKTATPRTTVSRKKTTQAPAAQKQPVQEANPNKPFSGAVGRRKKAVARAWLRPGTGKVQVNGINAETYFDTPASRLDAMHVFAVCPIVGNYDFQIGVFGGGKRGQAGAVKLAIARALVAHDETLRPVLRAGNVLTVDSRVKERKKYGQKGARRKFQFVKR